jgi:hypothetical protein
VAPGQEASVRAVILALLGLGLALPRGAGAQDVTQAGAATAGRPARAPVELALDDGLLVLPDSELGEIGFAIGLRASVPLARWLSLEGRYLASVHDGPELRGDAFFHSGAFDLRLMPARRSDRLGVRPYALAGLGIYGVRGAPVEAAEIGAQLPLGVGLQIDVTPRVAVGAEYLYRVLAGGGFFEGAPGAWSVTGNIDVRL